MRNVGLKDPLHDRIFLPYGVSLSAARAFAAFALTTCSPCFPVNYSKRPVRSGLIYWLFYDLQARVAKLHSTKCAHVVSWPKEKRMERASLL